MSRSARSLIKILEKEGFEFKRSKGSHHLYHNPTTKKTVVVPIHGKKDLPKGTYYAILRQAGIKKDER